MEHFGNTVTGNWDTGKAPFRRCQLNGSWLKVLAILSMTVDHAACLVLRFSDGFTEPLFIAWGRSVSWYFLLRCVGRLAFPLFAFLVVEGFLHTRNVRQYALSLLAFALLSIVPWSLARYGLPFSLRSLNVLFTLLIGVAAMTAVRRWEQRCLKTLRLAVALIALLATAAVLHTDYGAVGVSFIVMLYVLRGRPILQAAIGFGILPMRWLASLAFIPIALYNGRRGFIRGAFAKYAFYLYYPLHLLLLYLIREALMA